MAKPTSRVLAIWSGLVWFSEEQMTGFTFFLFFRATMVFPELDGRVLAFYNKSKVI